MERQEFKIKTRSINFQIPGPLNTFCKTKNRALVPGTCKPPYTGWRTTNYGIKLNYAACYVKLKSS